MSLQERTDVYESLVIEKKTAWGFFILFKAFHQGNQHMNHEIDVLSKHDRLHAGFPLEYYTTNLSVTVVVHCQYLNH